MDVRLERAGLTGASALSALLMLGGCAQPASPAASAPAAPGAAPATVAAPAPRHHFVKQGAGKTYPRDLVTSENKLTAAMTDGRYNFIDEIWNPGFAVVPHFHTEHAEIFYVRSGQVEWTVNGETHVMGAGDLVYIPPDTVHAVKVVGTDSVRTLMIYTPGDYEEHLDEEQRYTPEQRKTPEVRDRLRSHLDFNPLTPAAAAQLVRPAPAGAAPVRAAGSWRTTATTPEPSRQHFSLKGKGETFTPENEVSEVKLSAVQSDGRFSFLDEIWNPGMAVPPHFHTAHTETFYIVSGQVEWTVGGETQVLGAGDLVHIPSDTVHSVKVVGDVPVQSLMLYSPGGYEYHSRREATYTPEQRKEPEILRRLREANDFNPVAPR